MSRQELRLLELAAEAQAQDRANREQKSMHLYRGERDGKPVIYVRASDEPAPLAVAFAVVDPEPA